MLIRISLIFAILCGLAVGTLNFIKVKEKIETLVTERNTEKGLKETAQRELASTKTKLAKTEADLTKTQNDLTAAIDEKTKALGEVAKANQRASQLTEELGRTKTELGDVQAEVARYRQSGLSPEQVIVLARTLKTTQETLNGAMEENKLLANRIQKLQYALDKFEGKHPIVYLPTNLKGKVLVFDPKWEFLVLDIGENQGVLPEGELLVSRNGQLVAKVIVRTIEKDRCIANVMPGPWKIGEIMEGDMVYPAHPQS